jgi:hypothetical protein
MLWPMPQNRNKQNLRDFLSLWMLLKKRPTQFGDNKHAPKKPATKVGELTWQSGNNKGGP